MSRTHCTHASLARKLLTHATHLMHACHVGYVCTPRVACARGVCSIRSCVWVQFVHGLRAYVLGVRKQLAGICVVGMACLCVSPLSLTLTTLRPLNPIRTDAMHYTLHTHTHVRTHTKIHTRTRKTCFQEPSVTQVSREYFGYLKIKKMTNHYWNFYFLK